MTSTPALSTTCSDPLVELPPSWIGGTFGRKQPTPYVRVEPTLVVEVRGDPATHGRERWRHGVRYLRSRPDLSPGDIPRDLDLET